MRDYIPGTGPYPHPRPTSIVRFGEAYIWSTYRFDPANHTGSTVKLFTTPKRQIGQGFHAPLKGIHTNMREGRRLGTTAEIDQVFWEVSGSTARDHHALWTAATWSWCFMQVVVDGSPLMVPSTISYALPHADHCGSCGAPLPHSRKCEYCGALNGEAQGQTLIGAFSYTKYPILIPRGAQFSIDVEIEDDFRPSFDVFLRFSLRGNYKHEIEVA